jgi:hypothetical protein
MVAWVAKTIRAARRVPWAKSRGRRANLTNAEQGRILDLLGTLRTDADK